MEFFGKVKGCGWSMASTKFIPKCRVFANLKRRIHSLAEDGMHIIPNWGQNIECHKEGTKTLSLGPRRPHGIPLLLTEVFHEVLRTD